MALLLCDNTVKNFPMEGYQIVKCCEIQSLKESFETFSKTNKTTVGVDNLQMENIIQEINMRKSRKANIVMFNVPESAGDNVQISDNETVKNILNIIDNSFNWSNVTMFRLGKIINKEKCRPIKVKLESKDIARLLMRGSKVLKQSKYAKVFIGSDLTPLQQDNRKKILREYNDRIANGENDIIIKYINNCPTIIKKN
ncbi:hypothetical protein RN001_003207 [Aquatica leii]|uniref:Uncharacterized protein n=1 Tax=Aquatica leii TaxID=1421715 RepID=A0AAN7SDT4_9COLE|nr:hypothetical protein RN001_003207 [Aquatica leii]